MERTVDCIGIDYSHYIPQAFWILVNNKVKNPSTLKEVIEQRFSVGRGGKYGACPSKPRIYASYDEAKIAAEKYKWTDVSIVQYVTPSRKG